MELAVERDDMSSCSPTDRREEAEAVLLWRNNLINQTPAYSSSFSFSSNDLPVVSLVNKYVTATPTRLAPPSIISDACIPIPLSDRSCEAQRNPTAPMMAPILPAAPEIPWQVDLNLAGKSSAGRMKVVVLGPKFEKKNVRQ